MKQILKSVVIVVAAATGGVAQADPSYLLSLAGSGIHQLDAFECPQQICATPFVMFDWTGLVTVVVDGDGPGIFTGSHVASIAFDPSTGFVPSFSAQSFNSSPSVTVAGGQVTAIDADLLFGSPASVSFSGLGVLFSQPPLHHFGSVMASGVLTAVPEPTTMELLLGGLVALSAVAGLRRRGA
jgi:hypothetical protein